MSTTIGAVGTLTSSWKGGRIAAVFKNMEIGICRSAYSMVKFLLAAS
jgi:hypothetical protein